MDETGNEAELTERALRGPSRGPAATRMGELVRRFGARALPLGVAALVIVVAGQHWLTRFRLVAATEQANITLGQGLIETQWDPVEAMLAAPAPVDVTAAPAGPALSAFLDERLAGTVIALRVLDPGGVPVFARGDAPRGAEVEEARRRALATRAITTARVTDAGGARDLLVTHVPALSTSPPPLRAVVEVTSDLTGTLHALGRRDLTLLASGALALAVAAVVLFAFARYAARALRREDARRRALERRLRLDALHDGLTGLPNRSLFKNRIQHVLDGMRRRPERRFGVMYVDLDRFKVVNDSLGHPSGDQLLKAAGTRIRAHLRPGDTVARLGGDEFGVLLENLDSLEALIYVAERIRSDFHRSFTIGGRECITTSSIGIFYGDRPGLTVDEIMLNADIALYEAKNQGKGRHELFDAKMHRRAMERIELERELQMAAERGELFLCFLPVIRLDSGRTVSLEALLRWQHPVRGTVAPEEFLPVAKEAGLIAAIDMWVLEQACAAFNQWKEARPECGDLRVSVNLSSLDFSDSLRGLGLIEKLEASGMAGSNLNIDLSESAVVDNTAVMSDVFKSLRGAGIEVCLDNFGTGFSSLSYLHRYRFDALKIDRSLVEAVAEDDTSRQVVRTIIEMGQILGIEVGAEGIETATQLDVLKSLGCSVGQGFLITAPLGVDEVVPFLDAHGIDSAPAPAAGAPAPAGPEPADPEPADPEPADPEPAGPEPAGPEPAGEEAGTKVVGNRRTRIYHLASSPFARRISAKNRVEFPSVEAAEIEGYQPASR